MEEQKSILDQLILHEDDKFSTNIVSKLIKLAPPEKWDIDYLITLKINQRLENGPFIILASMPYSPERDDAISTLIDGFFNFLALLRAIVKQGTRNEFKNPSTIAMLDTMYEAVQYEKPKEMNDIWEIGNFIASVDTLNKKIEKYLAVIKAKPLDPNSEDIHYLLDNFEELVDTEGYFDRLKLIAGQQQYILPIQFFYAFHQSQRLPREKRQEANLLLSSLFNTQYRKLHKLPGKTLVLIDFSGSMECGMISYRGRYDMNRFFLGCMTAYLIKQMTKECVIYGALGDDSRSNKNHCKVTPLRVEKCDDFASFLQECQRVYDTGSGGGIYTQYSLELLKEAGFSGLKSLVVISDSEDCTNPGHMFPRVPAVHIAEKQYTFNMEGKFGESFRTFSDEQMVTVDGYTNYFVEWLFWQYGISSPLAKAASFDQSAYRITL